MQVEHLDGTDAASVEPFRAVRVAAGDSVSLAISDRGELRAWGSFRVSFLFVSFLPLSLSFGVLIFSTTSDRLPRTKKQTDPRARFARCY